MQIFLETVYDLLSVCCWQLFSVTMHAKEISKLSGIILLLTFPLNLFGSLIFHHTLFKILNFLLTFSPITMFSHTILEDTNTKFKEFMVFFFCYIKNPLMESNQRQECIPVGCVPSAAVAVCWWGMGVSAQRGVSAYRGVHLPQWTEFLTHACENTTFPQLRLRTVKKTF